MNKGLLSMNKRGTIEARYSQEIQEKSTAMNKGEPEGQTEREAGIWLRTRRSGVRVPPGAPLSPSLSFSCKPLFSPRTLPQSHCHANVTLRAPGRLCRWLAPCARVPGEPTPTDKRVSSPGYYGAWRVAQLRREQPNSVACRTHGANCRSGNTKHRPS